MNCALGGTLYQDIAAQLPARSIASPQRHPRDKVHEVTVIEHSGLHRITGLTQFGVNSRHHQGVKRLANGLVATAHTEDGLIEGGGAARAKNSRWRCKWHPESLSDRYGEAQAIFDKFVEACKA